MKIGIYEKAINKKFSWKEKILIAKKAGFDYIELSIDETDEKLKRLDWSQKEIDEMLTLLKDNDFYFNSMCLSGHRKYPLGSENLTTRNKSLEIAQKAILLAKKLNIRIIQIAGYDVYYEPSNQKTVNNFIDGLIKMNQIATENSMMLAFEVMDTPFMGTIAKANKYVEIINSPWLQIYPDLGNLSQFSNQPENEIKKYFNHIVAYHVKEATKTQMRDLNYGEGNVNFTSLFKAIKVTNFNGPFTLEMWSLNEENETIEQAISKLKLAKQFIKNKFNEAGWNNV